MKTYTVTVYSDDQPVLTVTFEHRFQVAQALERVERLRQRVKSSTVRATVTESDAKPARVV